MPKNFIYTVAKCGEPGCEKGKGVHVGDEMWRFGIERQLPF